MARKGAIEQQKAGASSQVPPASTGVGVAKKAIGQQNISLAAVKAAETTPPPPPPSPTNSTKQQRGSSKERGIPQDSPAKKARLSKEAAGDTEIAKKADADTHNGKEPAADTENGKESAADTENGKESAADTVLAETEFVNDADGGNKYNFRPRNLHQASSDVQDKILEEDEDDDEDEDDEQVEDEDNKVTPTKINPNLARIKDKVNRGRPVKPVSPKGILLNVSFLMYLFNVSFLMYLF